MARFSTFLVLALAAAFGLATPTILEDRASSCCPDACAGNKQTCTDYHSSDACNYVSQFCTCC